jgi:hypothetical protein
MGIIDAYGDAIGARRRAFKIDGNLVVHNFSRPPECGGKPSTMWYRVVLGDGFAGLWLKDVYKDFIVCGYVALCLPVEDDVQSVFAAVNLILA